MSSTASMVHVQGVHGMHSSGGAWTTHKGSGRGCSTMHFDLSCLVPVSTITQAVKHQGLGQLWCVTLFQTSGTKDVSQTRTDRPKPSHLSSTLTEDSALSVIAPLSSFSSPLAVPFHPPRQRWCQNWPAPSIAGNPIITWKRAECAMSTTTALAKC